MIVDDTAGAQDEHAKRLLRMIFARWECSLCRLIKNQLVLLCTACNTITDFCSALPSIDCYRAVPALLLLETFSLTTDDTGSYMIMIVDV